MDPLEAGILQTIAHIEGNSVSVPFRTLANESILQAIYTLSLKIIT